MDDDPPKWQDCTEWHLLFDAICTARGFGDNASLAAAFCKEAGIDSATAYESALKNISNWRGGKFTPNPPNFRILGSILAVKNLEGAFERWNALYGKVRVGSKIKKGSDQSQDIRDNLDEHKKAFSAQEEIKKSIVLKRKNSIKIAFVATLAAFVAFLLFYEIDGNLEIVWHNKIKIGETRTIYSVRSRQGCSGPPPLFEEIKDFLPPQPFGDYSPGPVGTRRSDSCKRRVSVLAINFTPTQRGQFELVFFGDKVTIFVE